MLPSVALALLAFAIGAFGLLREFRGPLNGWLVRGMVLSVAVGIGTVAVVLRNDVLEERRAATSQASVAASQSSSRSNVSMAPTMTSGSSPAVP